METHIAGRIQLGQLEQRIRAKWNKQVVKQPIIDREVVILAVLCYIAML